MKKVYLDTNIFVNYFFTTYDKSEPIVHKHRAQAKLKEIEDGKCQGITSILTIMETYTSGRRIIATNTTKSLANVDTDVKNALKFFYSMKNLDIIPDNNCTTTIGDILKDGHGYISKYFGKDWNQNGKRKYKALYSPDAIHLSLAIRNHCDEFWTSDSDFEEINEPITVIIV